MTVINARQRLAVLIFSLGRDVIFFLDPREDEVNGVLCRHIFRGRFIDSHVKPDQSDIGRTDAEGACC